MNVLVIGNGGREHAIVDKISQSNLINKIYAIPGNPGISDIAIIEDINIDDNDRIVQFCKQQTISLVIIGPETALINNLSEDLKVNGIKVLGPSKMAAQIESSKEYAKKIMQKYNIPTAKSEYFTVYQDAKVYLEKNNTYPIVIKYDGLAAGKGVYIVDSFDDGNNVLIKLLKHNEFGSDGLIIEEFLDGDEFTLLSLVKNASVYPFQPARDFKRVFDNDEGLNTGGMGAICPYHNVSTDDYNEAKLILEKTAYALVLEDNSFVGVLYGGFIKTNNGIKVIEFNARFGDPETECILNNLESDLLQNILDLLDDKNVEMSFSDKVSVGLVLSAVGYPNEYDKDLDITSYLDLPFKIYHMQTKLKDGKLLSNGGRVLFILSEGVESKDAFNKIYDEMFQRKLLKLHYRKDLNKY